MFQIQDRSGEVLQIINLLTICHTLQTRRAALPPAGESNETSVGIAT